jgi:predicted Rossmann fold flavoprotein
MAGLSLKNISVRLIVNSRKRKEAFGEMMFAKFGVTGPVILLLSGEAVDALRDGSKVSLSIDLKPALSDKKLDARLLRDLAARGKEPADSFLRGLLPREMVPVCLSLTEIPRDCLAAQISAKRRGRLRAWLKDFRLEVTRSRPFDEAIVTAGGIETREINPRTLESRRTKGLFIAGELLDIQADTGGYNLQAAFSTGWLAGRSAAHGTL